MSIFAVTHNGGTWFVSCILICYLAYPFIQEVVKQLPRKAKIVLVVIGSFVLLYSPFIVAYFKTVGTYADTFIE